MGDYVLSALCWFWRNAQADSKREMSSFVIMRFPAKRGRQGPKALG